MNHYYLEREILFKGKSPYYNNWYCGSLVKSTVSKKSFVSNAEAFPAEVIPETVGQYTGFNDRNKNKIYDRSREVSYLAERNCSCTMVPRICSFYAI